jgi:hypothetical protein
MFRETDIQVIVITHHHSNGKGIRYLAPGLKVYHLPIVPIASQATLPQFLLFLPYFRHIMIRENIDLVHGHGTLSSLAHEAMYHSHLLGIRSVFTDHSLFGFGDAVGVLTNKLLAGALRNVEGVICVSNTGYVSSTNKGTLLTTQTREYSPSSPTRSKPRLRDPKRPHRRSIQAIPSSNRSRT